MALNLTIITIYLFFNILSSFSFLPWTSNGFTLKLIHRDTPQSPFYRPNLSDLDLFMINTKSAIARGSYFEQRVQSKSLRLPLQYIQPIFTVEVGLGTPVAKQTLIFDTGSDLTWIQCKPCIRCFKQDSPLFDIHKSSSYKKMPRKHTLSKRFKCNCFGCFYYVRYYSGQSTLGTASIETFTFQTSQGSSQSIPGLIFGCGRNNVGVFPSEINGILGFDKQSVSLARQLGTLIKARFSYCLPLINSNTSNTVESYIRFGDEAVIHGNNTRRIRLLRGNWSDIHYTMNLTDISMDGKKLGFTHSTFPGGCLIDSGSSISLLNRRAFSAATRWLTAYFSKFKDVRRYVGEDVPKELHCYTNPSSFTKFPNMSFHFQGADFKVPSENMFLSSKHMFCLAILASPNTNILGAYQQKNVRIVYDLKEGMLSFTPQDCSKDAS